MRLIDADALVMEIIENPPVYNTNRVVDVIKSQPTVGGWISVDDRLPNSNGCYIVWRPHFYPDFGMPAICYFDGTDTWYDSYGVDFSRTLCSNDITHWMPLPEPPEEDENEKAAD